MGRHPCERCYSESWDYTEPGCTCEYEARLGIELCDEIPPEGEIESVGKVEAIWDKGNAAVVEFSSESTNTATGKPLNDGEWHHVAAVVSANGAKLDDVQLYVDGVLQKSCETVGGNSPINTAQANWMGIGVLLSKSSYKLDEEMGMTGFDGLIDDFALWTRALSPDDLAAVYTGAADGKNAFDMESTFGLE